MDHGGHHHSGGGMGGDSGSSGNEGMDMSMGCKMNMLWNSDVDGVCVVFSQWRISGTGGMIASCLAVALLSILYAHLFYMIKRQDRKTAITLFLQQGAASNSTTHSSGDESGRASPSHFGAAQKNALTKLPRELRLQRASMYALTVALSFFLMLVAMTYNTYLFFSIVVGAFIGHIMYESEMDIGAILSGSSSKGLSCH